MRWLLALVLLIAAPAQAGSLAEFLAKHQPVAEFTTTKTALALEMCIGLSAGDWLGTPKVLRGEGTTLIGVGNKKVTIMAFRVDDHGASRKVAVMAGRAWDGRATEAAASCV